LYRGLLINFFVIFKLNVTSKCIDIEIIVGTSYYIRQLWGDQLEKQRSSQLPLVSSFELQNYVGNYVCIHYYYAELYTNYIVIYLWVIRMSVWIHRYEHRSRRRAKLKMQIFIIPVFLLSPRAECLTQYCVIIVTFSIIINVWM